jgi:hypothetical protein
VVSYQATSNSLNSGMGRVFDGRVAMRAPDRL